MAEQPDHERPPVSVAEYERTAMTRLSARADAYISGGAGDELTLRDNERAWGRLALVPRVLTGIANPGLEVRLLGRTRAHPLLIAPTAFARLAHPDGELALARAAAATGTTFCLSTLGSTTPEAVAQAVPEAARWFQLYVFADRGLTDELVSRAAASGYEALVVTADRPVIGTRDRERRFDVRHGPGQPSAPDATSAAEIARAGPTDFSAVIDPSLSWADIERLAARTSMPVLVKGVLCAADAVAALEHGAAGVIASNHGGRQLDSVPAAVDVLAEIVDAVGDRGDVLVDGGIRRGTDIVKALALGARSVLIGRPSLWGLSVDGAAGVQRVIELLLAELRTALALIGAPSAPAVDHRFVRPAPWATR